MRHYRFALFEGKKSQEVIRLDLANYLDKNISKYKCFIPEFQQFKLIQSIRKNGEYAQYILLKIAADFYDTPILLYYKRFYQTIPKQVFSPQDKPDTSKDDFDDCVQLLFTGKWEADHFDAITLNKKAAILPSEQLAPTIEAKQDDQLSLKSNYSQRTISQKPHLSERSLNEVGQAQNDIIRSILLFLLFGKSLQKLQLSQIPFLLKTQSNSSKGIFS